MKKLHLCILGCGKVAGTHSRVARKLGNRVTLFYASRDGSRAEEYRRRFGGAGSFGSYEEACLSDEVDAVLICTPHAHHLEHARLAARGGKHMLIEKPVTRNLEELAGIERAVAEAGVEAMVAENYYFKPLVESVRHHIDRGDIGDPLFFELNHVKRSKVTGWRADAEMMGGGALLEGGVHWINLLRRFAGNVSSVVAATPTRYYERVAPFEDSLEILFRFESGAVGKMLHTWNLTNAFATLSLSRIFGTEGNISFESNGIWMLVRGRRRRLKLPGLLDIMGYHAMMRHFVDSLLEGRSPAMGLAEARADMETVYAAYRSLETHRFEAPGAAPH